MKVSLLNFSTALFTLVWLTQPISAQSEPDTLLNIPVVEIKAKSIRSASIGSVEKRWTAREIRSLPVRNLADLLGASGNVYIKSYGLGSLATSSIRGGSAGQSLILWNGLPVQSPMVGQLDLSLLPLGSFDSISLKKGGAASSWGSGAVGGVVEMESGSHFGKSQYFGTETVLGDYGRFSQSGRMTIRKENFFTSTLFNYTEAENDFRYSIGDGIPLREQTNAALIQRIFTQDLGWKISDHDVLTAHFWHQNSFRQIPPTNVQSRSKAYQEDRINRVMLNFTRETKFWRLNAKGGYFKEELLYVDPLMLIDSPSEFETFLGEFTAQFTPNDRWSFLMGHTQMYTEANTSSYDDLTLEHRWSLFGTWVYTTSRFQVQAGARNEVVDDESVAFVPSIGAEYKFDHGWTLRGRIGKNFRLPTLNDRYWIPGGNPDLQAESGWSEELTLEKIYGFKKSALTISATGFNRLIDDWILWSRREGENFWSASNIASVWSRGLEIRAKGVFDLGISRLEIEGGYDRILSTSEENEDLPGMRSGKQLLYTPVEMGFISLSVSLKNIGVSYRHSYTGETRGINETIPAFQTADLRLEYSGLTSAAKLPFGSTLFFDVINLYNAEYFVIERRPMPGINFQAGVRFFYKQQ